MLTALLPPGRLWRLLGGDRLPALLLACADELARLDARARALLDEADPSTATEMLADHERELGLPQASTIEERRASVVARTISQQGYRPEDLQSSLSPLLGLAAADVAVIERTNAAAAAMGDVREVFRFFVFRNPALPGTYYLAGAQDLLDAIKPSHTQGHLIESISFLCDDPYSLCDRDLLGA